MFMSLCGLLGLCRAYQPSSCSLASVLVQHQAALFDLRLSVGSYGYAPSNSAWPQKAQSFQTSLFGNSNYGSGHVPELRTCGELWEYGIHSLTIHTPQIRLLLGVRDCLWVGGIDKKNGPKPQKRAQQTVLSCKLVALWNRFSGVCPKCRC